MRRSSLAASAFLALSFSLGSSCDEGSTAISSYPQLSTAVSVVRDHEGVPHIYASNDLDAMYASGYMQAVDRLLQMDLMRRQALGRAAELGGLGMRDQDRIVRTVDIAKWGRQSAARTRAEHPDVYNLIVAWTEGVNRRIREVRDGSAPLPYGYGPAELNFQPELWSMDDAFTISRLINFNNGSELEYDALASLLRQFAPALYATMPVFQPFESVPILPPEDRPTSRTPVAARVTAPLLPAPPLPPDAAERFARFTRTFSGIRPTNSNNWAVSGEHTSDGRSLIAGDPHQPLKSPSLLWAHHVNSADAGGTLDVIGFGFVGSPGVQLGHNRKVAWTATVAFPDTTDLLAVMYDPAGGTVQLGSKTVAVNVRHESIVVGGQASPFEMDVVEIPGHGVLLPDDIFPLPLAPSGYTTMLQWTGFRPTVEAAAFFGFDVAANTTDFERSLATMDMGSFNFIYADASHIGYGVRCLVPDRGDTATMGEPWAIQDGDDDRNVWTGKFLPYSLLPTSHGGTRGFLTSSNNDPYGFTANGRVDDDPFYYGAFFDPGTRAARIDAELTKLVARGNVATADFETLQLDTQSRFADRILPLLDDAWSRLNTDPALAPFRGRADLASLQAELHAWDHRYELDSSASVAAEGFQLFLSRRLFASSLGSLFQPLLEGDPPTMLRLAGLVVTESFPGADTLMPEGRDVILLESLVEAADWLTTRYGSVDPSLRTWGAIHGTHFGPIAGGLPMLEGGVIPTRGSNGTVSVGNTVFFDGTGQPKARLDSDSGSIYRMIAGFDADGTPRAEWIFPRGESGEPTSPHFADLVADWAAGTYRPVAFRRADVTAAQESTMTITP